jgi:hypothetical protein
MTYSRARGSRAMYVAFEKESNAIESLILAVSVPCSFFLKEIYVKYNML